MVRKLRLLAVLFAILGLIVADASAFAQPNGKGQNRKEQRAAEPSREKQQHKHYPGKTLVGDNIKKNGTHKLHEHGKFTAFVSVSNGKIAGLNVKHAEKGDVPVTKYKTTRNMAQGARTGIQVASFVLAQSQYVGTTWIGYGYIDDSGSEIIYWFPYDMILDGDTGAIEYYPAY